jgi:hypothetical protein
VFKLRNDTGYPFFSLVKKESSFPHETEIIKTKTSKLNILNIKGKDK